MPVTCDIKMTFGCRFLTFGAILTFYPFPRINNAASPSQPRPPDKSGARPVKVEIFCDGRRLDCESRAQLTGQTGHEQDHDGDNMLKIHSAKITVIASKDSSIILYLE